MTSYRYLGSGTTDSNGVAHLTEDASGETVTGYVGQGVGEMGIFATLDNPVTQSSIQSETYTVIDALFKDMGTSTDYGAWSNWTGKEPKLTRDTYCKMEVDTGKTDARMYKQLDTSNNNVCIEFDMNLQTTNKNDVFATLRDNQPSVKGNVDINRLESYGASINNWVHLKFVVSSTNCLVYVNDNTTPYTYNSSGITRFYFQVDGSTSISELDYKNFVIYPI